MPSESNGISWITFIIVIILIIAVVIIFIILFDRQFGTDVEAIALGSIFTVIQQGVITGQTDELLQGGSILYIGRSNMNLNLTFPSGRSIPGIIVGITNTTINPITVIEGPGVRIDPGNHTDLAMPLTIFGKSYAQFVVTNINQYIRVI